MAKAKRAVKKVYFPPQIAVRKDDDMEDLFIVGDPADPAGIDAAEGGKVAIYELKDVYVYRINPRLEAQ